MQYTPHYNLNLPEGTDIVNPLVQDNPNYSAIDTALYDNKLRVVGTATHVKTGTNHAITLADSDINQFKFVATGDYLTGDTFTVDGVTVTPRIADGSSIPNGAFKINSTVLCILDGTILNIMNIGGIQTASDMPYDNSGSGLSASNVQNAIDETVGMINRGSVSVTADGVKTYQTLLNDLAAIVDGAKLTNHSTLEIGNLIMHINRKSTTPWRFGSADTTGASSVRVFAASFSTALSSCHYTVNTLGSSNSVSSYDSLVPDPGDKLTLNY